MYDKSYIYHQKNDSNAKVNSDRIVFRLEQLNATSSEKVFYFFIVRTSICSFSYPISTNAVS